MNLLALIESLLPIGEEIASIFIHNPKSQHKFAAVVSTVDALTPVLAGLGAASTSTPATPTAAEPADFVPAGVPSAH